MDCRQTFAEIRARFLWGVRWGVAVCLLLMPVLLCPWPHSRHSLYDQLGNGHWPVQVSVAVILGLGLVFALTTRARLREPADVVSLTQSGEIGGDLEDRAKTDCLGLLLPLAVNAYAIYQFTHPRRGDYLFHRPMNPDTIVALGIIGMGIALFLHAIGFAPYQRVPFVKYVLASVGVVLFLYGSSWPPTVR